MKKLSSPVPNSLTPIALAVGVMVFAGAISSVKAEEAKPQEVVITGVRAALQKSLAQKRNADGLVEVVTAEDIGKMPDKNVADAVQRLPGVTISAASAGEGGFDENDRVSMRGTNPSLTLTMINGHMIASGDWFVLNQVGDVGRSVSYSLLPSELVGSVIVNKSSQADLVEGGVAGTVNIITRKPLDFSKSLTLEGSVGAVYSDLPKKTDHQISALLNWKNEEKTFGIMLQAFSEKRSLRRDGQEMLGYEKIAAGSKIALSNPDLAGVAFPSAIGSALFEQTRHRKGGLIDLQFKPNKDLTLDFSAFRSDMEATNYNRNYLVWISKVLNKGAGQAPDPGYTVRNGTLVSAKFSPVAGNQYVVVDQIYRPGASSYTSFYNFDAKFRANDALTFTSKLGYTKGGGETPSQAVYEGDVFNTGASYTLRGMSGAADAALLAGDASKFTGSKLDWIFGASPSRTKDEESWAQLDGEYKIASGVFTNVKFGARFAEHKRSSELVSQGPLWSADPFADANAPAWNGQTYPSDFASGLGGNFPRNVWQLDKNVLEAWGNKFSNRDPVTRRNWTGEFSMKEKNTAAYIMTGLEGDKWTGNIGLRLVQTKESVLTNVAIPGSVCEALKPCSVPGAITTSAFGSYYQKEINNTYNDVLPSASFRIDLNKETVLRLAASRTLTRPDFSALGGSVSLDDTNKTGSGGNPNLKPVVSNNFDATVEWYFAPKSMVSAGVFYMDLTSYISYGVQNMVFKNIKTNKDETYAVTSPVNSSGKVKGLELAYQQPFANGFGVLANYTFADGKEKGGGDLVGTSRNTYNLTGYYENDKFNARLAYTYRSSFFNGLNRSSAAYQDSIGVLAASLGYKINDNLSVSFDALNLNNPTLKYYVDNPDRPNAFYRNGRQYYLSLRGKM
ncbi:TonB-dependent receptor [Massilia sp. W12]|uniref:TonB-dependent receptor n=1 Tax=Massilia sp. W12 TaxID=3126507 RepID=UPI0030D2A7DB